jgi:hypothetical protein
MTVLLAVKDGNVVLLASDSAATDDDGMLQLRRDPKLFSLRVFASDKQVYTLYYGLQGSYSVGQCLSRFQSPFWNQKKMKNAYEYLTQTWVPALRKWRSKEFGDEKKETPLEDATLLLVFDAQIFKVFEDGQIAHAATDFDACGDVALGALAAGWEAGLRSWELLDTACKVSEQYTSSVRAPFHTIACFRIEK